MSQTLVEMATEACGMVGLSQAHHIAVAKNAIKRRYRELVQAHEWPEFRREIAISVAAGATSTALPFVVDVIQSVYNLTLDQQLERMSARTIEEQHGTEMATTGAQTAYMIQGVLGANALLLPPFAAPVSVKSTNSGDNCPVRVEGYTAATGLPFAVTATVNGTTDVFFSFTLSVSFQELMVSSFTKDADTAGDINLVQSGVSTALAIIAPGGRESRYTWLRFNAAAPSATSMRVQCTVVADDITSDSDISLLRGSEGILVYGAAADLYRFAQMHQKALATESLYQSMKNEYVTRGILLDESPSASGTMHRYREQVW